VHDVVYRKHLIENMTSNGTTSIFSSGSALSIVLTSAATAGVDGRGGFRVTESTPASSLPPMVAVYRLAGVDGEATEDTVDDLVDPEAPVTHASAEERERALEAEFGSTRLLLTHHNGRGVFTLLRSIQAVVSNTLRRIRRDDVDSSEHCGTGGAEPNSSRIEFQTSPPCSGLTRLRYAAKLSSNRKTLLRARAPTVLLTLLLDMLTILEKESSSSVDEETKTNPTAAILQELIEVLTSDISSSDGGAADEGYESDLAQDASSMPLLLKSIETISLSPPLRHIIAKLLPFLTYGQTDMSRELAKHFDTNIDMELLSDSVSSSEQESRTSILMDTFVKTAISLPTNDVCNSLRLELINCGFVERVATFIVREMPWQPPSWSPALWQKTDNADKGGKKKMLDHSWKAYYLRSGVRTAFKILAGLCRKHPPTQDRVAKLPEFLRACHWLEGTSDCAVLDIATGGLGLLAETLLDEISEGNTEVSKMVESARTKTRQRKKELAQERRNRALLKMSSFGPLAGGAVNAADQPAARTGFASILAPVVGLFQSQSPDRDSATRTKAKKSRKDSLKSSDSLDKPAWLAEAELMEDETGLTCAVCQEGRTLQPKELLGLYAYVKKVGIPTDRCGAREGIDGTNLFRALPDELPMSLHGTVTIEEWFISAKSAASRIPGTTTANTETHGSVASRRATVYSTTVSAGNGIHFTCHLRARQADRNHPKAPKTEWDGAMLRNNRAKCNVILPLISSHSSKVPLMAVDSALTDHHNAIANLLGSTPKSALWNLLHDVRLLLLRMAYGESLSSFQLPAAILPVDGG
jgi:E3 ubiquitin-protein ligase UBR4